MLTATLAGVRGTQDAVANGDTRTLTILHTHTKESATITFRRNGSYDADALKQLNWLLRDWRLDEPTKMNPKLFDIVWQVYREVGSQEPINVVSAYRSPQTNAMLRRRSKAVAEHSQHMRGYAMDFFLPDVSMARVREVGMRLQDGGVGFYPSAYNPFVHLDAGSVRSWPRMPAAQLARLFPDGRTVHIPREGRPLAGYEDAKATILARGGSVAGYATYAEADSEGSGGRKSLWAMLFGGGDDEDTEFYRQPAERVQPAGSRAAAASRGRERYAAAAPVDTGSTNSEDGGARAFLTGGASPAPLFRPEAPAPARPAPVVLAAAEPPSAPERPTTDLFVPTPLAAEGRGRIAAAPVPPRRPEDFAGLLLATVPLPPSRPGGAPLSGSAPLVAAALKGEMLQPPVRFDIAAAADERAALRALFDAAATGGDGRRRADVSIARTSARPLASVEIGGDEPRLRTRFVTEGRDEPRPDRFTGPAVAPRSVLR